MATNRNRITAVCTHPACRWHSGDVSRHAMRELAMAHIRETGMTHKVNIFGPDAAVHGDIRLHSGLDVPIRTKSGRAVLETVEPVNPLQRGGIGGDFQPPPLLDDSFEAPAPEMEMDFGGQELD